MLVLAIVAAATFDYGKAGSYQLAETYAWIPQIGVSWALGVNGLGLVMLLLAALLVPLVILAGWRETEDALATRDAETEPTDDNPSNGGGYFALVLALEAFMMLIFAARDVFVFYLAFEAMLIPLYFMIGRYGTGQRRQAAIKFVLYSLAGGLIMLVGVVTLWVYSSHEPGAFLLENLVGKGLLPPGVEVGIFWTFFIAFAVKAPLFPVHTWLPDTTQAARPGTSVLLVGVLDKIGTFGMITLVLPLFPHAAGQFRTIILVLAVVSVIYGGLAAIAARDLMRLIAFTSVSHFGLMVAGIFVGNKTALTGAMIFMVAHGLSIAGMFLLGGFLTRRAGTQEIGDFGGMQRVTPVLAGTFLFTGLAAIGLPGLSGFVPEYLVLLGSFAAQPWVAVVGVGGVILSALYLLLPYQRIFTGPPRPERSDLTDLDVREKTAIAPLLVAMLVLGLWVAPLVATLSPVTDTVTEMQGVGQAQTNNGGSAK